MKFEYSFYVLFQLLCGSVTLAASVVKPAIMPVPLKMEVREGNFKLGTDAKIYVDADSRETGKYLAKCVAAPMGFHIPVVVVSQGAAENKGILLTTKKANLSLGEEGYELAVSTNFVVIRGVAQAGVFYGVQSLLQLMPPEIYGGRRIDGKEWNVPCVEIEDLPRFRWRGMLLDVSRHFFDKAEIKRLLDLMAIQKLNTFQWHLVDHDGWRIEIKRYPRLTQIGAWRGDIGYGMDPRLSTAYGADGRYGGYYTQEDIQEIVAYAKERHIEIVPEIEMPGHSAAALRAYPELVCPHCPTDACII